MIAARYKLVPHRPLARQYRILCGSQNPQGLSICRGDLGKLFAGAEQARNGRWVHFTPLVSGSMARDAEGIWRESRQRRPFVSGMDGGRNVGRGVTPANLQHDAQGRPLKWLPALVDVAGKDQVILECPRCHAVNVVLWADVVRAMERLLSLA